MGFDSPHPLHTSSGLRKYDGVIMRMSATTLLETHRGVTLAGIEVVARVSCAGVRVGESVPPVRVLVDTTAICRQVTAWQRHRRLRGANVVAFGERRDERRRLIGEVCSGCSTRGRILIDSNHDVLRAHNEVTTSKSSNPSIGAATTTLHNPLGASDLADLLLRKTCEAPGLTKELLRAPGDAFPASSWRPLLVGLLGNGLVGQPGHSVSRSSPVRGVLSFAWMLAH
jgi:hypothetical protein